MFFLPCAQADILLKKEEVEEKIMSTRHHNCLLRALSYPEYKSGQKLRKLRAAISKYAEQHRTEMLGGYSIQGWVEGQSNKRSFDQWVTAFATSNLMSDLIVAQIWASIKSDEVFVWRPTTSGFELMKLCHCTNATSHCTKASSTTRCVRHVVYREEQKHFNVLTIPLPALERAVSEAVPSTLAQVCSCAMPSLATSP